MSERRCVVTGNTCGTDTRAEGHACHCSECHAWTAERLTPSCDSELAAIRSKIPRLATEDSGWPEVHALLRMADELTGACDAWESDHAKAMRDLSSVEKERDDLHAKLEETECERAGLEDNYRCAVLEKKELEAKLADWKARAAVAYDAKTELEAKLAEAEKKVQQWYDSAIANGKKAEAAEARALELTADSWQELIDILHMDVAVHNYAEQAKSKVLEFKAEIARLKEEHAAARADILRLQQAVAILDGGFG